MKSLALQVNDLPLKFLILSQEIRIKPIHTIHSFRLDGYQIRGVRLKPSGVLREYLKTLNKQFVITFLPHSELRLTVQNELHSCVELFRSHRASEGKRKGRI